jgi:hypothetical protein
MAIDLSQLNIPKDVSDDIKRMVNAPEFYEKVVKESAQIHVDDFKKKSSIGRGPSGEKYKELSDFYRKRKKSLSNEDDKPNLRYGYDDKGKRRKPKAMDSIMYREGQQNRETTIYFDSRANPSGRVTAEEYMSMHQTGEYVKHRRKFFPEEDDMRSPAQSQNKSKVGKKLQEYLMTPRTITIG